MALREERDLENIRIGGLMTMGIRTTALEKERSRKLEWAQNDH